MIDCAFEPGLVDGRKLEVDRLGVRDERVQRLVGDLVVGGVHRAPDELIDV
jgi:hypothetical protein